MVMVRLPGDSHKVITDNKRVTICRRRHFLQSLAACKLDTAELEDQAIELEVADVAVKVAKGNVPLAMRRAAVTAQSCHPTRSSARRGAGRQCPATHCRTQQRPLTAPSPEPAAAAALP